MTKKITLWWRNLTKSQKLWTAGAPLLILLLGLIAHDTPINLLIGVVGMIYVAIYGVGNTRWAFILGVLYVSLYTIVCLQNRIMLDALQNIILIPVYIASFIKWGKSQTTPQNLSKRNTIILFITFPLMILSLYMISMSLNGNYSLLDSLNTTCTLYAMFLGYFGLSINWAFWTINNVVSAVIFGLALLTPTGSVAVFAMKLIFFFNGLIGWYTWYKMGKNKEEITN